METQAAKGTGRRPQDIYVLGVGHLAAAVRVALVSRGLVCCELAEALNRGEEAGAGEMGAGEASALVVACSDFENPASFDDAARRAEADGSPTVFASLAGETASEGAARVINEIVALVSAGAAARAGQGARPGHVGARRDDSRHARPISGTLRTLF